MSLSQWLKEFQDLHDRAKGGTLDPEDLAAYHAAREELAGVLMSAQRLSVPPGHKARRTLRAARALQVEVDFGSRTIRGMTQQVSAGGFGALLSPWPLLGESVQTALRLPGGEVLKATARVVEVREQGGNAARVSFEFVKLGQAEVERLETFVFDAVLEQFRRRIHRPRTRCPAGERSAVRTCEGRGARRARHGALPTVPRRATSLDVWHAAGGVGFDVDGYGGDAEPASERTCRGGGVADEWLIEARNRSLGVISPPDCPRESLK